MQQALNGLIVFAIKYGGTARLKPGGTAAPRRSGPGSD